jgi:choice-of-anchor A domain-containing protein
MNLRNTKFCSSFSTLSLVLVCTQSSVALATPIDLGAAKDYNAFIREDFSATSSDVEGRVAVGGNASIANYSVNIKDGSQLYGDTTTKPAMVVGGDLNFSSGQIAGDVYVGGSYSAHSTASITNGVVTQGGPPRLILIANSIV